MSEAAATSSGPEQQYKFNVAMTCSGCSGAVERALKKQEGVSKIDISLETQTVLVHAHPPATFDIVREKIAKTGKTINSSEVVVS
ncbi:Cytosolic copper metallochaperone [Puccinia graminis f. sp. tritici]|uniref:Cytosolic copper metallochaperone n=1 Tax=Puccinia graminis f. sp. tritici TaxID=56615 RepID=A0A5B0PHS4_PUCGR|nr:Cytosolic copper metallochaperone [Puccinia graminis f. sp. tritici]KAA1123204.1 Cytosolic copper metallochaperone [Puccinia graminis f. sp. tritici]